VINSPSLQFPECTVAIESLSPPIKSAADAINYGSDPHYLSGFPDDLSGWGSELREKALV
jgi:hypothetical protein